MSPSTSNRSRFPLKTNPSFSRSARASPRRCVWSPSAQFRGRSDCWWRASLEWLAIDGCSTESTLHAKAVREVRGCVLSSRVADAGSAAIRKLNGCRADERVRFARGHRGAYGSVGRRLRLRSDQCTRRTRSNCRSTRAAFHTQTRLRLGHPSRNDAGDGVWRSRRPDQLQILHARAGGTASSGRRLQLNHRRSTHVARRTSGYRGGYGPAARWALDVSPSTMGSATVKQVPVPGADSRLKLPPCASATRRAR